MEIELLKKERAKDFIDYCKVYRDSIDTPYLSDKELDNFVINEENPTYILLDNNKSIIGAASLVLDTYHRMEKVGRFRILHSVESSKDAYNLMLSSMKKHVKGLNEFIISIKEQDKDKRKILEDIEFSIKSFSYSMIRGNKKVRDISFPEGFEIRSFKEGRDEADWCEIRNIGFGISDSIMTPETVNIYWEDDGHLEGGMMLLYHDNKPVGTVRASKEVEDGKSYAYISVICVKPEYRKIGLGRKLLRSAIQFGNKNGLRNSMLEVNTQNKDALGLYKNEGFEIIYAIAFYNYNLK